DKSDDESEKDNLQIANKAWGKKYFTPIIFTILILAYIIQNLFIFEALATYIPLMVIIAFVGMYGPSFDFKFLSNNKFKAVVFIIFVILLLPAIYIFNIKPVNANIDFIKAMIAPSDTPIEQRIAAYENVLSRNTQGNQEYRRYLVDYYNNIISQWIRDSKLQEAYPADKMATITNSVEKEVENQLKENGHSVSNYLLAIRFYEMASVFDPSRLEKAKQAFDRAKELSPGRPQVYFEGANVHLYLANYYKYLKDQNKVDNSYVSAADLVYEGSTKYYYKENAVNDFLSIISNLSANKEFADIIVKRGIAGKSISQITSEVKSWIDESSVDQAQKQAMTDNLKVFINTFLTLDPGNKDLSAQLLQLSK
ncbi:MAG: hypothetical protein WCV92_03585, partial [Candidatus Buchananbacteria bacterium]